MKKLVIACVALVLASAAIGGCRVGGEIDTDGDVSYPGGLAR